PLAGTGVWRSVLVDGQCSSCAAAREGERARRQRIERQRGQLIRLLGGVKPYREFTFERYRVNIGNRVAFEAAQQFEPSEDNLYLWGPWGVGKTHLAVAVIRRSFVKGASVALVSPARLVRKLRMKTPDDEQQTIDFFIRVGVLVIDDLGVGTETSYARQIIQE